MVWTCYKFATGSASNNVVSDGAVAWFSFTICLFLDTVPILSNKIPIFAAFVRKVSAKCSETVMMNLHKIGHTFVNIRINSHTLHFHHPIVFRLFAIAESISIVNNRIKYSAKWDRGLIVDICYYHLK